LRKLRSNVWAHAIGRDPPERLSDVAGSCGHVDMLKVPGALRAENQLIFKVPVWYAGRDHGASRPGGGTPLSWRVYDWCLSYIAEVDETLNCQVYWSNLSPRLLFRSPSASRAMPETGNLVAFVRIEQIAVRLIQSISGIVLRRVPTIKSPFVYVLASLFLLLQVSNIFCDLKPLNDHPLCNSLFFLRTEHLSKK
jgi:hypothetical protein